jgi:hypothetical protein
MIAIVVKLTPEEAVVVEVNVLVITEEIDVLADEIEELETVVGLWLIDEVIELVMTVDVFDEEDDADVLLSVVLEELTGCMSENIASSAEPAM